MSAALTAPTLDLSGTHRIPQPRLVKVELRKMADTRAGMWLLITIGAVATLVMGGFFIWGKNDDQAYLDFLAYAGIPENVLLPVLGILLITQEWGQRTALVTFTQVPARSRVLVAKLLAALLFALGALALAALVAVPLALLGGADQPFGDVTAGILGRIVLGFMISILWGLAFGAALLNSAFAIVLYFLVPTIVSIIGAIWTPMQDKLLWIDLGTTQGQLFNAEGLSGEEWAQLGTGFLLWVIIPAAFGVWRILRAEIK